MIAVQMRDEDGDEPAGVKPRAGNLRLRPFAAIKQQPLAFARDGQRADVALERGLALTRSQRNNSHQPFTISY